ncbi:MAG: 16S rRNA (guanine(966)-N(2))-methyltransferase RsmD [Deltaproteobacteria bacterium]|nr:16S rRNA (guanine(966)-N(2))-methyltransferase RsmD [Deltaproteobacteria bacterium]
MRITGGRSKGRTLAAIPKGAPIRPTSDKVREAIFSIMGQHLTGLRVLDLFSGTGSLGLEALSRGAEFAAFIDHSRDSIGLIHRNLARCGYQASAVILKGDLKRGIPRGPLLNRERFHLVFLDPPYKCDGIPFVLQHPTLAKILAPGVRVVAETAKGVTLPERIGSLTRTDMRSYGDTQITLYRDKETI